MISEKELHMWCTMPASWESLAPSIHVSEDGNTQGRKHFKEPAKKRHQIFRKLTQMEQKMSLRDTIKVQMKPCSAKPCYTKLQMDDRNHQQKNAVTYCQFCKTCFQRQFSLQQEAQIAELNAATWDCAAEADEGRNVWLSNKDLLLKDTDYSKRELWLTI